MSLIADAGLGANAAIEASDRQAAFDLLGQIDLASQAESIVDAILADPATYGFSASG